MKRFSSYDKINHQSSTTTQNIVIYYLSLPGDVCYVDQPRWWAILASRRPCAWLRSGCSGNSRRWLNCAFSSHPDRPSRNRIYTCSTSYGCILHSSGSATCSWDTPETTASVIYVPNSIDLTQLRNTPCSWRPANSSWPPPRSRCTSFSALRVWLRRLCGASGATGRRRTVRALRWDTPSRRNDRCHSQQRVTYALLLSMTIYSARSNGSNRTKTRPNHQFIHFYEFFFQMNLTVTLSMIN